MRYVKKVARGGRDVRGCRTEALRYNFEPASGSLRRRGARVGRRGPFTLHCALIEHYQRLLLSS